MTDGPDHRTPAVSEEGQPAPDLVFATDRIPPKIRFEVWQDVLSTLFSVMPDPAESMSRFHGRIESHAIGHLMFFEAVFSAQWLRRRPHWNDDDDQAPLLLLCCDAGGCQGYNGWQKVHLGPGDTGLLDLRQSLDIHIGSPRVWMLLIPRHLLANVGARAASFHPGVMHHHDGLYGSVLRDLLQTTWRQLKSGTCRQFDMVESMLMASILGAFAYVHISPEVRLSPSHQKLFAKIQAYVDCHLEENLSVARLSHNVACSRSQLYRLFESYGGVSGYIRHARLHQCLAALSGLHGKPPRITDLSARFQFSDPSHFSRQFRETFGVTPSKVPDVGAWRNHVTKPPD